jgi:hypothetical protein
MLASPETPQMWFPAAGEGKCEAFLKKFLVDKSGKNSYNHLVETMRGLLPV